MLLAHLRPHPRALIVIFTGALLWAGCHGESADTRICRAFERLSRAGTNPREAIAIEAMQEIKDAGKPSDPRIARVVRGATRLGNQIAVSGVGTLEDLWEACKEVGIRVPLPTST